MPSIPQKIYKKKSPAIFFPDILLTDSRTDARADTYGRPLLTYRRTGKTRSCECWVAESGQRSSGHSVSWWICRLQITVAGRSRVSQPAWPSGLQRCSSCRHILSAAFVPRFFLHYSKLSRAPPPSRRRTFEDLLKQGFTGRAPFLSPNQ